MAERLIRVFVDRYQDSQSLRVSPATQMGSAPAINITRRAAALYSRTTTSKVALCTRRLECSQRSRPQGSSKPLDSAIWFRRRDGVIYTQNVAIAHHAKAPKLLSIFLVCIELLLHWHTSLISACVHCGCLHKHLASLVACSRPTCCHRELQPCA
jgi:hypothetical protein